MAEKLAGQGINVVMVALEEPLLHETHKELCARFPSVQFRKVGVDLSKSDSSAYMSPIIEATKDIVVSLLFNNAGFITTGFFAYTALGRSVANFNCNAACVLPITHHFVKKMMDENIKGLVAFTSSSAGVCVCACLAVCLCLYQCGCVSVCMYVRNSRRHPPKQALSPTH